MTIINRAPLPSGRRLPSLPVLAGEERTKHKESSSNKEKTLFYLITPILQDSPFIR